MKNEVDHQHRKLVSRSSYPGITESPLLPHFQYFQFQLMKHCILILFFKVDLFWFLLDLYLSTFCFANSFFILKFDLNFTANFREFEENIIDSSLWLFIINVGRPKDVHSKGAPSERVRNIYILFYNPLLCLFYYNDPQRAYSYKSLFDTLLEGW